MLVLISPAKVQNSDLSKEFQQFTLPQFSNEAKYLVSLLKNYSISELSELLKININIATQNSERLLKWSFPHSLENSKQAILTYDGAVFRAFNGKTLSEKARKYAQNHFRILSGLYGMLKPLDLIMPYRLDVSTKLKNKEDNDLYPFWRERVTNEVNRLCEENGLQTIVNLMSKEYFKTLNKKKVKSRIITVDFLEYQPDTDKFKAIVIYTKQARGSMARFIIDNQIKTADELKLFTGLGYEYSEKLSKKDNFVFVR